MGAKTPVVEQWEKIQRWKRHPEWKTKNAVRILKVLKPTLLNWKKKYWNMDAPPPGCGRRCRMPGGGRRMRPLAPYEKEILVYYEARTQERSPMTFKELLTYSRTKPEFKKLNRNTQRTRTKCYIKRVKEARAASAESDRARSIAQANCQTAVEEVTPSLEEENNQTAVEEDSQSTEEEISQSAVGGDDQSAVEEEDQSVAVADDQSVEVGVGQSASGEKDQSTVEVEEDEDEDEDEVEEEEQQQQEEEEEEEEEEGGEVNETSSVDDITVEESSDDCRRCPDLTLKALEVMLASSPTYAADGVIRSFRRFPLVLKPKVKAYVMDRLPHGAVKTPDHNSASLPWPVIRLCEAKVSALQSRVPDLREQNVALQIAGVEIIAATSLVAMKRWHRAVEALDTLKNTLSWITSINFTARVHPSFKVARDPRLERRLEAFPLFSPQMEHPDLAGKGLISDATVNLLLGKLVGQRADVVYVNPTRLNVVVTGDIYYETTHLKTFFYGLSTETILFPVNCNGNHWCGIAIKLQEAAVLIYDPMGSSCLQVVRDLAKDVLPYFPPPPESKRRYVSEAKTGSLV